MSADELGAGRFPRRSCFACGKGCLPEHAPEYVIQNPEDANDVRTAYLCRVPVTALGDGLLGFDGCGPTFAADPRYRARLMSDPYIGVPAVTLLVAI